MLTYRYSSFTPKHSLLLFFYFKVYFTPFFKDDIDKYFEFLELPITVIAVREPFKICLPLLELVMYTCQSTIGRWNAWCDDTVAVDITVAGLSYLPNYASEEGCVAYCCLPARGTGDKALPHLSELLKWNETHRGSKRLPVKRICSVSGWISCRPHELLNHWQENGKRKRQRDRERRRGEGRGALEL